MAVARVSDELRVPDAGSVARRARRPRLLRRRGWLEAREEALGYAHRVSLFEMFEARLEHALVGVHVAFVDELDGVPELAIAALTRVAPRDSDAVLELVVRVRVRPRGIDLSLDLSPPLRRDVAVCAAAPRALRVKQRLILSRLSSGTSSLFHSFTRSRAHACVPDRAFFHSFAPRFNILYSSSDAYTRRTWYCNVVLTRDKTADACESLKVAA